MFDADRDLYLWENLYNSSFSPSTIHSDSKIAAYYCKYLFQKAISPFKFTIPEEWPLNYFLYTLYAFGIGCVFDTSQFGVIYQQCTISGYNLYYQPHTAIVANPVLKEAYPGRTWEMQIGKDCELIHLQPDYTGIMDIVTYYADLLACFAAAIAVNTFNSKIAFVFAAKNKAIAESFKKLYDDIAGGKPAVVADERLFNQKGELNLELFNRDVKQSYIVSDLLEDMRKTEEKFLTEIGIPNANTDKKERLITSEVESNNFETKSKCEVWKDTLQLCFDKCNSMFPGLNLKVDWRDEGNATGSDGKSALAVS